MAALRIGVALPHYGPHAGPDAIALVAAAAEQAGLDSLWALERLLRPVSLASQLPEPYATVFDPLESLTWAAGHTSRLTLGTSILNALFHSPVVLARRLATLDRLSGGRVVVGVGQGWMPEEFAAANVSMERRGGGFAEHLEAMRACWRPDPVEHRGPRYPIPRSEVGPKPTAGHLPILVAATARPAVERAARIGDGFAAVLQDWDTTAAELDWYRSAGGAGPVVLRVNVGQVQPGGPGPAGADPEELRAHFDEARRLSIDEVIVDLNMVGCAPDDQARYLQELSAARTRWATSFSTRRLYSRMKGAGSLAEDASSEEGGDGRPRLEGEIDGPAAAPRPAAVTFATTEHFTLQVARGSTIAESTGRATMFLGAVSGGLIALGLIATASRVGTAFYALGLILLPTLAFTGLVTFERVLQSGIEDLRYARRIALLRGYYLDEAPELTPYLLSVLEQRQTDLPQPPPDAGVKQHRLQVQGLWGGAWQGYRTVAGMVAVITAVLAGSAVGLLTAILSAHSLAAALAAGGAAAVATLAALMRYQASAWKRSASNRIMPDQGEAPPSAPNSS